jgi:hypothetical protein
VFRSLCHHTGDEYGGDVRAHLPPFKAGSMTGHYDPDLPQNDPDPELLRKNHADRTDRARAARWGLGGSFQPTFDRFIET